MRLLAPDEQSPRNAERQKNAAWYTPHGWLWEILSTVVSLFCTLALVVLLFRLRDRPYEEWNSYVGLNPIISTLTTVARGTLLLSVSACLSQGKWLHFTKQSKLNAMDVFDQASRGPKGALIIVLDSKTYLGLPTLAALITMLALAIGPFTQQVVMYDQGTIDTESPRAFFDYAHHYASGVPSLASGESINFGPTEDNIDSDMQGAIYRGLYQNQSSWEPSFACPSDCKWPDTYTVLGFAGACENVTIATLATKICIASSDNSALHTCKMITPGGVVINTTIFDTVYETVAVLNASIFESPNMPPMEAIGPKVAGYAYYNPGDDTDAAGSVKFSEAVSECSLNLTAYKYSQLSSTSNEFKFGHIERVPLESGHADFVRDILFFNQSGIPELSISSVDLGALKGFFISTLFTGSRLRGESRPALQPGCSAAFKDYGASEITTRLAKSMTDALQRNRASQQYTGLYARAVTFVRVRWVWLILLGTLEAAGIVLLVGTIIRARLGKKSRVMEVVAISPLVLAHRS